MRKFANLFTHQSTEKTLELEDQKEIAYKAIEKQLEEQKKLIEQQQQQIVQLQAEKQAHENNIQVLQQNYRTNSTNSNNNNNASTTSTALIIKGTTEPNKQLTLNPAECALISAVKEGNLPVVQVLLGKTLYFKISDLALRRKINVYRVKLKLAVGRYEGLQTAIRALVSDLSTTHADNWSFKEFSRYLEHHFALSDKGNGGNTDEVFGHLNKLLLGPLTQAQFQLLTKTYTEKFAASLKERKTISIDADVLNQLQVVGGCLEQQYKTFCEMPNLVPGKTLMNESLACLLYLFSEVKLAKEKVKAKFDKARELLQSNTLEVGENYTQLAKYLVDDSNKADTTPLCQQEKMFTIGDLKQWLGKEDNAVSFALEDQNQLNLLEILAVTSFSTEKTTIIDRPDYSACVKYLTNAQLVTGEHTGIAQVLLYLYQYQTTPNHDHAFINVKTFEDIFETLRSWYKEEPLWVLKETASGFEDGTLKHDKAYLNGERSNFQRVINFLLRDEETLVRFVNQAELTSALALLGNLTHSDEVLAAAIFHVFNGVGRVKRFIHPHEALYKYSVNYQQESQKGSESVGFIATVRRDQLELIKKLEEKDKQLEENNKKRGENGKKPGEYEAEREALLPKRSSPPSIRSSLDTTENTQTLTLHL